jgi:saccharopine dehydrogenase-like NADP-dependent oxidoreductase
MKTELTEDAKELIKENPQLINTLARVFNSNILDAVLEHGQDMLEENIVDDITGLMQDNISDIRIKY